MNRLFTSDLDRFQRGSKFVNQINEFYDKVDTIVQKNASIIPEGIIVNKTFGFLVPDKLVEDIVFYEPNPLPFTVIDEIKNMFNNHFKE